LGERPRRAAELDVGRELDHPPVPPVEQLGQRILQQRQGGGAVRDIRHDPSDHAWFESDADAICRPFDRSLELLGGHGGHELGSLAQELGEGVVAERTVVEVGPNGDDEAKTAPPIEHCFCERGEEGLRGRDTALGEDLLELIDHEHEL
jgi:hypothetical protein